jgi:Arc/MetJ family transcription regulator
MPRYNVYRKEIAMRTNIVLDDKLVNNCIKATGIKTKKSLIDYALKELLRHKEQKKILELKGKITWEGSLDEMRKGYKT